jgi:hypothetical protein
VLRGEAKLLVTSAYQIEEVYLGKNWGLLGRM